MVFVCWHASCIVYSEFNEKNLVYTACFNSCHWNLKVKTMKKSILHLATTAAMVGGLAFAVSGSVVAGIADTKHNLGSSSTIGGEHSGTAEICVFCHMPHGSTTDA